MKEEVHSMYSYTDNREKNFYGVQARDRLIYFLEGDELKNEINKYLDETVHKMVGHPCLMLQINDFLSNLGFNIDECVLTRMPVYYKNMTIADMGYSKEMNFGTYGCLTEYTVSQCYSKYKRKDEDLELFFDYIIENHYSKKLERDIDDIYIKRLDYDTFDFVGAIEIDFFLINDDSTKYRLLIDMYTGYALLYDGDTIRVYGINRGISKNLAKSYREKGLKNIPKMFLMAMYGINPYDYSIIDKEYNRYCLTNSEEKLTETKFKSLFKERVKLTR